MKKEDLLKLIEDDDWGLLSVQPKNSTAITADERLVASFQEINNFVKENGRMPEAGKGIQEHQLATRLQSIRQDTSKSESLLDFDEHKLLNIKKKKIKSVKDIFEDDDLGLLEKDDESLFQLNNVPKKTTMPAYVARRKVCKDFQKYEALFKSCQSDLYLGKRKLIPFTNEQEIDKGYFFVLNGVLLYIAGIGKRELKNNKLNARLRCVFENGTESDMLLRSLSAELYKNGRRVTEHEDKLLDNFYGISPEDNKTGFIYILRSLSDDEKISSIKNLYKIGFSTIPVEQRIKNASDDPTFLMAPVSIVTTFECYNFNPQKLELLLHSFFGSACLNLDVFDTNNKRFTPREWFVAPLTIVEKTVELIINGGIVNYKYDLMKQEIVIR